MTGSLHGVYAEIHAERARQDEKWGEQNHPDGTGPEVGWLPMPTGLSVRAVDVASFLTRRTDDAAMRGDCTWLDILLEEVAEAFAEDDPAALRAELVQLAAVAVQWVEAIDRRTAG